MVNRLTKRPIETLAASLSFREDPGIEMAARASGVTVERPCAVSGYPPASGSKDAPAAKFVGYMQPLRMAAVPDPAAYA